MIAFSKLTSTLELPSIKLISLTLITLNLVHNSSLLVMLLLLTVTLYIFVLMVIHSFLLNLKLNLNPNVVICMLVIVLYLMPALNSLLSLPVTIALLFVIFLNLVAYNCLPVIMLSVPF